MKPRSMEEKISYLLFLMGFAGLACTAALCIFVFHKAFREQAWTALEREAALVAAGCAQVDAPSQLETYVDGSLRITLIASDGSVLFESATNQPMENHLSRPEIQQAMKSGVGRDCRDSQTLGYETYYYAMLLTNGDILRVAQDSETIWSIYDAALPAIVLSCFLMMGAAAIIAGLLTKSLVQPVLKMTDDLDHIQENVPYKELIPFAESIHSDRMLRENNEKMRQEFTANVSHELKTPLTSVIGYADTLRSRTLPSEMQFEAANAIYTEGKRLERMSFALLDLFALERSEPSFSRVQTGALAASVQKSCEYRLARQKQSLQCDVEEAAVWGEPELLRTLLLNLLDNAHKASPSGAVLQLRGRVVPSGYLFCVIDPGRGIPPEELSRITDPFYMVDKSRARAAGGAGLGLTLCRKIAEVHGSSLRFESVVGEGTRVSFLLKGEQK